MAREKPEARLIRLSRKESNALYGERICDTKNHGSEFSEAGVSDVTGCLDGIFFACEFKAPETYGNNVDRALSKGPTLKQKAFILRVNRAGGVGWFAATTDQWMTGLEAVAYLASTGTRMILPSRLSGVDIICTCKRGACEYDTDWGCFFCRNADLSIPCPNE